MGVVHLGGPYVAAVDGLREGLRELGFEEGQHYTLLVRDAKGDVKAAEAAARALEQDKVDLIYAISSSAALAAKRGTTRVPIVFYAGSDPVAIGLAESYRKPGGRLTGVHGQLTTLLPSDSSCSRRSSPTCDASSPSTTLTIPRRSGA